MLLHELVGACLHGGFDVGDQVFHAVPDLLDAGLEQLDQRRHELDLFLGRQHTHARIDLAEDRAKVGKCSLEVLTGLRLAAWGSLASLGSREGIYRSQQLVDRRIELNCLDVLANRQRGNPLVVPVEHKSIG